MKTLIVLLFTLVTTISFAQDRMGRADIRQMAQRARMVDGRLDG